MLELHCPGPCPYRALGQDCRVWPGDARCHAVLAPWSYLRLPSRSSDLPGGLRSAASSLLQFGKAGVINALAPAVPSPGSTSRLPGPWHLPLWVFLYGPNPPQTHSLQSPSPALSEAGSGLCSAMPPSHLQAGAPEGRAHRGDRATLPTVGTGPGCACLLPATDVSFLCVKWGCSRCSWPAM